jgi:hypothetical protein
MRGVLPAGKLVAPHMSVTTIQIAVPIFRRTQLEVCMSRLGGGDREFVINIEMTGSNKSISMLPKKRPKEIADIPELRISQKIGHTHVVRRHNWQAEAMSRNE